MRKAIIAAIGAAPLAVASAAAHEQDSQDSTWRDKDQQSSERQGQDKPQQQGERRSQPQDERMARQQQEKTAPRPYAQHDSAWISVDGTVQSVAPHSFVLDYGEDTITVEMDDGDRDADGYQLMQGDKVRVAGRVDHNLFTDTTIEAGSVFVENIGTYFFASAVDDEDRMLTYTHPLTISTTTLRGTVEEVNENDFTVRSPGGEIQVSTDRLGYDPLDEAGYQRIEEGDLVLVTGNMDAGFFEAQRELKARSVVVLDGAGPSDDDQRSAQALRDTQPAVDDRPPENGSY